VSLFFQLSLGSYYNKITHLSRNVFPHELTDNILVWPTILSLIMHLNWCMCVMGLVACNDVEFSVEQ